MKKKIDLVPADFKNPIRLDRELKIQPEEYWLKRGEARVLSLFQLMSERVPAYKDFLKKNKIKPEKIRSIADFRQIPTLCKENYLREYSLESLCWDGELKEKRWTISANSGSTGNVYYFPREIDQDWQYAIVAELYLRNNFKIHQRKTLYIDTFAMGAWIGGVFTFEAIRLVAERGRYGLSIFTPGIFVDEIFKCLEAMGDKFDQVIIGGYPPFVKDLVDEGRRRKIRWEKYHLGFVFSAEGFSEKFRDYIFKRTGVTNAYCGSLNHYGTADMGTMSHETPLSVLVRRRAIVSPGLRTGLFAERNRLPTFTQYIPELFYFEEEESLICSAYSGLPLVRYDLKDNGGVFTLEQVKDIFQKHGLDLTREVAVENLQATVWNLPFVYVYERNDFTVKLSGANIFPETIRNSLQLKKYEKLVTGKFTMLIGYDRRQNQYLEINVELKKGVVKREGLCNSIQKTIIRFLLSENSEYNVLYQTDPERVTPRVILWEYGSQNYFKCGGKQMWIKK